MNDETSEPRPTGAYTPVFIGGAARSGTTLLNALVSTSQSCNPFAPEFHYLATLGQSLASNLMIFDRSQRFFVRSREALIENHFRLMNAVVHEAWAALGQPEFLVIKHCKLTPMFALLAKHMPSARFLVSIRDARDVVASMLRASSKQRGRTQPISDDEIRLIITQFNTYYGAILSAAKGSLKGRLLIVQHEKLASGDYRTLESFLGLTDIDPQRLWKRSVFDIRRLEQDPMFSQHWGRPITNESVATYLDTLDDTTAERIFAETVGTSVAIASLIEDIESELGHASLDSQRIRTTGTR